MELLDNYRTMPVSLQSNFEFKYKSCFPLGSAVSSLTWTDIYFLHLFIVAFFKCILLIREFVNDHCTTDFQEFSIFSFYSGYAYCCGSILSLVPIIFSFVFGYGDV